MSKFRVGDEVRVRHGVEHTGGDENYVGAVVDLDGLDVYMVEFEGQTWPWPRWYGEWELQPADVVALGKEN